MMEPFVVRNNMAIAGWVFTFIWVGGLVVISWLFATENGFGQFDPFVESGIMMLFWMGAFVLIAELMTKPRVRLEIRPRTLQLTLAWLFRRQRVTLSGQELESLELRRGSDKEGDPYFELILTTPSGHEVTVCESHDRDTVEAMHRDILARIDAPGLT